MKIMSIYLSYLMGAEEISDHDLESLGIRIVEKTSSGSRKLEIPPVAILVYVELIKEKLSDGFWNEVVGSDEIRFIFKLRDGSVKEIILSPDTEREIDAFCADLNDEPPDKTANVYKYLSENDFYHDFVLEYYADQIARNEKVRNTA